MGKKFLEGFRALTLGVLIVLGCLHFKGMLTHLLSIDFTKISAPQLISYEWIVPLISLSSLLGRRREISLVAALPSWNGFGFTCLFLVALSLSAQLGKPPLQLLSIAGLVCSVAHAFWGKEGAKLLWFPMGFLVFAVPVSFYVSCVEALSPAFSAFLTRFGATVELSGFEYFRDALNLKGLTLETLSPNSGIRSLFAMAAITVAFAHFTVKTRLQRWTLYVCTIPITYFTNLIRSLVICLIALRLDQKWAINFYSHFSQYMVFFIGLMFIFQVANLITKISERLKKPTAKEWLNSLEVHETRLSEPEQSLFKSATIISLTLLFAVGAFFFTGQKAPADVHPASEHREK